MGKTCSAGLINSGISLLLNLEKSLRLQQTLFLPNLDGILVVHDVLKVFILLLVLIVIAKLVSGLFVKVDLILLGLLQVCVELLDLVMGYTEFTQRLHAFLLLFYKLANLFLTILLLAYTNITESNSF